MCFQAELRDFKELYGQERATVFFTSAASRTSRSLERLLLFHERPFKHPGKTMPFSLLEVDNLQYTRLVKAGP